ncbi:MAG: hypothetical protein LBH40_04615 [Alphaproteobacteria bacterium]|nr:hypothetical protein [Alphaproteobacteria bacterium]
MIYNLLLRTYNAVFYIIAIFSLLLLFGKFKEKTRQRLLLNKIPKNNDKYIWLHGASVGEVLSAESLINSLLNKYPFIKIIITSHTKTSKNIVVNKFDNNRVIHRYLPYDCGILVKKFLKRYNPITVLWLEQDFFPIFLANIHKRKIPLLLLNARISDKSFLKWKKLKFIISKILNYFDVIYPMSLNNKKKLDKLSGKDNKFIGNLKYTNITSKEIIANKFASEITILQKYLGNSLVLTALSTHRSEELLIAKIHYKLKEAGINLKTVIIPRHIERMDLILKDFAKNNFKASLFSQLKEEVDIVLVDSMGKTGMFCLQADITFIGKSLYLKGGHNLLEPLSVGTPVIFGKNMGNFKDIVLDTLQNQAGIKVKTEKDLYEELLEIFNNPQKLQQLKNNTDFVQKNNQDILKNFMGEISCRLKI